MSLNIRLGVCFAYVIHPTKREKNLRNLNHFLHFLSHGESMHCECLILMTFLLNRQTFATLRHQSKRSLRNLGFEKIPTQRWYWKLTVKNGWLLLMNSWRTSHWKTSERRYRHTSHGTSSTATKWSMRTLGVRSQWFSSSLPQATVKLTYKSCTPVWKSLYKRR